MDRRDAWHEEGQIINEEESEDSEFGWEIDGLHLCQSNDV